MKTFEGQVLFLDRSDINTDEIIPAKYLTEAAKAALKPYCLEDLKLPGFDAARDLPGKAAVVTRANFGCGSSREHAPWALEANGVNVVVAEGFARIFRQNMFNCGMLAASLPAATVDELFRRFASKPTRLRVDPARKVLEFASGDDRLEAPFAVDDFDWELVKAGGWVEYADWKY